MSIDNYYYPDRIINFSVSNASVSLTTVNSSASAYGISFPTDKLKPGKFYRISECTSSGGSYCAVAFYGGGHGQNVNSFISVASYGNGLFQVPLYTTQTAIVFAWSNIASATQTVALTGFRLEEVSFH